ncbi:uncharacterized protein [Drosophila takahashii]|uniref:uncharacterized protein n=1 Tax=Drosophila takahashii TaxID=29030 RepID=UPI0038994787
MKTLSVRRQLFPFVKSTYLAQYLKYFDGNKNIIKQIARNYTIFLRGADFWELDRVHPMLAALSILILVEYKRTDVDRSLRTKLMNRFLDRIECVQPMTVHMMVERLLIDLEEVNACQDTSLFKLAEVLSQCSRGRPLAVCLLWEVLHRRLPHLEVTMHRFRKLHELVEAVKLLPANEPPNWGDGTMTRARRLKLEELVNLVQTIELLLRLLMGDNKELLDIGYPDHFFYLSSTDALTLKKWCLELVNQMPPKYCDRSEKLNVTFNNLMSILKKSTIPHRPVRTKVLPLIKE